MSTFVVILKNCAEDDCDSALFRLNKHGLIVPVMGHCPVLSFLALFLKLKVFVKDRDKTISCQHVTLMHNGILGCRQIFKVVQPRDIGF